jgi:hypothetical protein
MPEPSPEARELAERLRGDTPLDELCDKLEWYVRFTSDRLEDSAAVLVPALADALDKADLPPPQDWLDEQLPVILVRL